MRCSSRAQRGCAVFHERSEVGMFSFCEAKEGFDLAPSGEGVSGADEYSSYRAQRGCAVFLSVIFVVSSIFVRYLVYIK